ncbi:hypothetical protein K435DRAFT_867952 [Dendrothele bispora CBS 962.96]|uniref:Uncharacterized protein n=1 Tax=Dendrothele bispora (strain CBS 962.96) TaxID=1314807 RepID=A0A4S8LCY5_DENBC|nr:hypothetical protein K435DRAFT_867952 [Dendrothele bispora CBS 962.96]
MYTNVYAQVLKAGGNSVANPEAALWIGTSGYGYEGRKNEFEVMEGVFEVLTPGTLTSESDGKNGKNAGIPSVQKGDKVRFYVQGVTERGEVLGWDRSVWVEIDV